MNFRSSVLWAKRNVGLYNLSSFGNPFYVLFIGGEQRPVFFDIDRTLPELRRIERAYPDIREEFERVLPHQDKMPRYHDIDSNLVNSSGRYNRQSRWNVFMLYCYDALPHENRALCPKTCAALESIPGLNQAFFSILDPGKSIPAHTGPTRSYIRYHLGLRVPKVNPPKIRVKDQWYTWKEGESVLFDDSWDHEIINNATEVRAVLIVDVMRPMPALPMFVSKSTRFLGSRFYGPELVKKARKFVIPQESRPVRG